MKRLIVVIIGCLSIYLAGCKKEVQQPEEEIPVFYFNGSVNASPVNLQAGVDSYYMYSYYKQDSSNGLYSFFGNIKQVNCTDCRNHITFKIFDSKPCSIGGMAAIDTSLIPAMYSYLRDTISTAKRTVAFTAYSSPGDTVQSYLWSFGDGTISSVQNPVHDYAPGNYNACLDITYKNGCHGSSCNSLTTGSSSSNDCIVSINDTAGVTGNLVQFGAVVKAINPVSYSWNFNDSISGVNNTSTLANPNHDFTTPGIYSVTLQISNISCTAQTSKNVATPNYTNGCYANYTYTILPNNNIPFSKIVIYWMDAAGKIYSSENVTQPADSYFQILSVDEYSLNEHQQRTKKIHARLKCILSNGISTVTLTEGDAVFAIAFR